MHTFASTLASFFMASSQIPHAMEQTLMVPFGIMACQRWDVVVIDIGNKICTAWNSNADDTYYMCEKSNHSTQWALGLLCVQVSRSGELEGSTVACDALTNACVAARAPHVRSRFSLVRFSFTSRPFRPSSPRSACTKGRRSLGSSKPR